LALLIVDIDGTLLLGTGKPPPLTQAVREVYGEEYLLDLNTVGRTDKGLFQEITARLGGEEGTIKNAYLKALEASYVQSPPRLLPGVVEFLQRAQREDCSLVLGTGNLEAAARFKLDYFDLNKYFPVGGFGDDSPGREPIIATAIAAARSYYRREWEDVWVIGDAPADIQGARANAIKAAIVATGWYGKEDLVPYAPDLLVDDLWELAYIWWGEGKEGS
jgi:phosphoglycolate phosphatase